MKKCVKALYVLIGGHILAVHLIISANQALGIGYLGKYGTTSPYEDFGAPKGSRPTPTGQKLFHTAK